MKIIVSDSISIGAMEEDRIMEESKLNGIECKRYSMKPDSIDNYVNWKIQFHVFLDSIGDSEAVMNLSSLIQLTALLSLNRFEVSEAEIRIWDPDEDEFVYCRWDGEKLLSGDVEYVPVEVKQSSLIRDLREMWGKYAE